MKLVINLWKNLKKNWNYYVTNFKENSDKAIKGWLFLTHTKSKALHSTNKKTPVNSGLLLWTESVLKRKTCSSPTHDVSPHVVHVHGDTPTHVI